nr:MAG TPA: hypothetical protein [Caudoviricetes sp.]
MNPKFRYKFNQIKSPHFIKIYTQLYFLLKDNKAEKIQRTTLVFNTNEIKGNTDILIDIPIENSIQSKILTSNIQSVKPLKSWNSTLYVYSFNLNETTHSLVARSIGAYDQAYEIKIDVLHYI